MLDLPIEQKYRKENRMFHSSGFAIAAGVVGVAAAAGSAAVSINASQQAAKGLASSNKKYSQALSNALATYNANQSAVTSKLNSLDPTKRIPSFSLLGEPPVYKTDKKGNIRKDKQGNPIIKEPAKASAVLESIQGANLITQNTISELDRIVPGAADSRAQAMQIAEDWQNRVIDQYTKTQEGYNLLAQSRAVIEGQLPQLEEVRRVTDRLLTGDLPEATKQQITRAIAERGGAGFSPQAAGRTAGFQVGQGALAQQLLQSAEERQRFGLQASQGVAQQTMGLAGQLGALGGQFGALAQTSANIGEAARGWEGTKQTWNRIALDFMPRPENIMQIGLVGRGQEIDKLRLATQQQQIIADMNAQAFAASTGVAGAQSGARQSTIAGNLASQGAIASGIQGIGSAAAGGLSGISQAYGQYSAAQPVNYERVYGKAIPAGGTTTPGFGNFDYGSGTGA